MTNQVIKTVPEYYNHLVELLEQGKESYQKSNIKILNANLKIASDIEFHFDLGQ